MASRAPARPRQRRTEVLAYVFFHRPRSRVARSTYERALARFHLQLARTPTDGFQENAALRLPAAPWKESSRRPLYVDWYVLDGFESLDPIRAVASRPPWVRAHRAIARQAANGWGALYAASPGARPPDLSDRLVWFSSATLATSSGRNLARGGPPEGTLWRRQLAIGPSPEFCWVTGGPIPGGLMRRSTVSRPEFIVRREWGGPVAPPTPDRPRPSR